MSETIARPIAWASSDGTDLEAVLTQLDGTQCLQERARLVEAAVRATLPLADSIAARYAGRGIDSEDLLQVARTALVVAVRRYRPG
ncbi:MAG: sigma factor, partial [Lapillicoccus sp.]